VNNSDKKEIKLFSRYYPYLIGIIYRTKDIKKAPAKLIVGAFFII
jgi:hypothetical protein